MALVAATIDTTGTQQVYLSSGDNAITSMIICNVHTYNPALPEANTALLTVYAVPNSGGLAGTPGVDNMIINQLPITAGETLSLEQEKMVFADSDTLVAVSSVSNSLSIVISTLAV